MFEKKGFIYFCDTLDHFKNGFIRLLGESEDKVTEFIKLVGESIDLERFNNPKQQVQLIKKSWSIVFPETEYKKKNTSHKVTLENLQTFNSNSFTKLTHAQNYGVALDSSFDHGWLVDLRLNDSLAKIATEYEAEYFVGEKHKIGYGNYFEQTWREEKSVRLVDELKANLLKLDIDLHTMRILDIGCGSGDFMRTLNSQNYNCEGLETSKFAGDIARSKGSTVWSLDLLEFAKSNLDDFDLLTMWDFIEHVENPYHYFLAASRILKRNGFLVIKTPNINSLEFDIFGGSFHSLKLEHLHYFSIKSIEAFLSKAGFKLILEKRISHLLSGFLNSSICNYAITNGKHSDMYLIAQKID